MKSIAFFFVLLTLFSFIISDCEIKEGEDKCCWLNHNGCCKPPSPGNLRQICTQAFKRCCKKKVFDEETQTYKFEYN